tara:strand:- start:71 stop:466 length:396 start_codon:yes stop_codon:yes gene_type:complete
MDWEDCVMTIGQVGSKEFNQYGKENPMYKHGMFGTPTYNTYSMMKQRCNNQKHSAFHNYGGRGIKVCDRWLKSFVHFLEDMGIRPDNKTLDRIDNDKGYSPDNCRWATSKEQIANSRTVLNAKYKRGKPNG